MQQKTKSINDWCSSRGGHTHTHTHTDCQLTTIYCLRRRRCSGGKPGTQREPMLAQGEHPGQDFGAERLQ